MVLVGGESIEYQGCQGAAAVLHAHGAYRRHEFRGCMPSKLFISHGMVGKVCTGMDADMN